MWNKLDDKKKNIVALLVVIAVFYIAYRFSFSQAITAYQLNSKLHREASLQMEDAAYPHLNKKYLFYQKVLSSYKVNKHEMDTKLWQDVSGMAVSKNLQVSYNPAQFGSDTAATHKIYLQQFGFKGNYVNLVKLLDTLSKSSQIGKVSSLSIGTPKDFSRPVKTEVLEMQLSLSAVEK